MPEPSAAEARTVGSPGPGTDPVQRLWLLWRQGQRPDLRTFLDRGGIGVPMTLPAEDVAELQAFRVEAEAVLREAAPEVLPAPRLDPER